MSKILYEIRSGNSTVDLVSSFREAYSTWKGAQKGASLHEIKEGKRKLLVPARNNKKGGAFLAQFLKEKDNATLSQRSTHKKVV